MDNQEIDKLADGMTEQQVENVIAGWAAKTESIIISEKKEAKEKLRLFKVLVRLGDSKQLACATVMLKKPIDKETEEFYRMAYEN